jgi:flagellar hook-associated protein 3 FlgL
VSSRLTVIDTVLSDMTGKISQGLTTALGANGTDKTALQREAAAQTLIGLRDAILGDFNTSFNGIYVFSGTNSSTPPYSLAPVTEAGVYQGNADEATVDVASGRTAKVTYNGQSLAKGTATNDILTEFKSLIDNVRAGNSTQISSGMQALQTALDRISAVQTSVGTQMKSLEELKPQLSEMKLQAETRLDKTENVDMAEAISGMTQAETAYRAALGAAGAATKTSLMDYIR